MSNYEVETCRGETTQFRGYRVCNVVHLRGLCKSCYEYARNNGLLEEVAAPRKTKRYPDPEWWHKSYDWPEDMKARYRAANGL